MIRLQVCNVHGLVLWSLLEERHAAASGTKVVDRRGGKGQSWPLGACRWDFEQEQKGDRQLMERLPTDSRQSMA